MAEQAYFDSELGEAVVPWRGPRLPRWWAYACSAAVWVFVIWGALLVGWSIPYILFISFMLLFALPWLANRYATAIWGSGQPLAVSPAEMAGPTTDGSAGYVRWSDVSSIEYVPASGWPGVWRTPATLAVRKHNGDSLRFRLPAMSEDEAGRLIEVLREIARRSGLDLA